MTQVIVLFNLVQENNTHFSIWNWTKIMKWWVFRIAQCWVRPIETTQRSICSGLTLHLSDISETRVCYNIVESYNNYVNDQLCEVTLCRARYLKRVVLGLQVIGLIEYRCSVFLSRASAAHKRLIGVFHNRCWLYWGCLYMLLKVLHHMLN